MTRSVLLEAEKQGWYCDPEDTSVGLFGDVWSHCEDAEVKVSGTGMVIADKVITHYDRLLCTGCGATYIVEVGSEPADQEAWA